MELAVWVSMKELVFYARHMKVQGHWTTDHCMQLDGILSAIQHGRSIEAAMLIYDGPGTGFIPFTKFMWLHSNKFRRCDAGYYIVEREGNHVDNGCAVMTEQGRIQVVDMFADNTVFYPVDEHASCGPIEDEESSIATVTSVEVEQAIMDLELWKENAL